MNGGLSLFNHQRGQKLNTKFLRGLTLELLAELTPDSDYDLAIHIIDAKTMIALNESIMCHAGSTDVITLEYSGGTDGGLIGEIHICLDEAVVQAGRFKTTWTGELVRYLIHGLLHLRGYTDLRPAARRKMKREEDRLLRWLGRRFDLRKLGGNSKLHA